MNEQQLKEAWRSLKLRGQSINIDSPHLINNMEKEISKFENRIRFRDRREIITAVGLILFLTTLGIKEDGYLRIGCFLLIGYFIWIIFYLVRAKSRPTFNLHDGVRAQLFEYKAYIEKQRNLVKNVLYWYLLPILPGAIFIALGMDSLAGTLSSLLIFFVASIYVYRTNQRAARENYDGILEKISSNINGLDGHSKM